MNLGSNILVGQVGDARRIFDEIPTPPAITCPACQIFDFESFVCLSVRYSVLNRLPACLSDIRS